MKSLVYTLIMFAIAALAASCSSKVISPATSKVRKAKTLHPVTPDAYSDVSANPKPVYGKHYFLIDFRVKTKSREIVGYMGYISISSHPTNSLLRLSVATLLAAHSSYVSIVGVTAMGRTEFNEFFKRGELQPVYTKNTYILALN